MVAHDQAAAAALWPIVPAERTKLMEELTQGSRRSLGGGWRGALSARASLSIAASACPRVGPASAADSNHRREQRDLAARETAAKEGRAERPRRSTAQQVAQQMWRHCSGGSADGNECIVISLYAFVPLYRRSPVALLRGVRISCGRARPSILVRKDYTCLRRGGS